MFILHNPILVLFLTSFCHTSCFTLDFLSNTNLNTLLFSLTIMKLPISPFSAVLTFIFAQGRDMANENKQHLGSFSVVISNKNLRSSKETILSSTSPFSMAEGTDNYKKLSHQAYACDGTNGMEKDTTIGVGVGVGDGDGDGDGGTDIDTDDDKKLSSTSYHSRQGVKKGGRYDKDDKNKIDKGGLLDILVGVCVCMCMCRCV